MTVRSILNALVALNVQGVVMHLLVAYGSLEIGAKRVLPQYSDSDRGLGCGKGCRRPVDELGKTIKEYSFELVLTRDDLAANSQSAENKQKAEAWEESG